MPFTRSLLIVVAVTGLTPAAAAPPRGAQPIGSPGRWVTTNDYPTDAVAQRAEGTTAFAVKVAPDGQVMDCQISESSGSEAFDRRTCELVSLRAWFDPAIDGEGKPAEGYYSNRVRWRLPAGEVPSSITVKPPVEGDTVISYVVEPDGSIGRCTVERRDGGNNASFSRTLLACPAGQKTKPFLDAQGQPIRRRVRIHDSITLEPAM
ncbi:energy transducer TonB [Novosphingobium sp. G106]|uniref:energy transducer TonB n=1 Tax=Novosphingobium sp. G106 TaxID=2849500 RepID=UPI001C2DA5DB|nr:energy transducer TonB [Novosphingobium sp. G106]MBV1687059.1 energy transducer TonB [Novosphingobium sp. G106]